MKKVNYPEKIFYFSTPGTIVGSIVLILFLSTFFYVGIRLVQVSLLYSILVLLVTIFCCYLTLPDMYYNIKHLKKRNPALILTDETLTDNTNHLEYKWTDIKEVKEGDINSESESGYIFIKLKSHDISLRIVPMGIRAKKGEILRELQKYHLNAVVKTNNQVS